VRMCGCADVRMLALTACAKALAVAQLAMGLLDMPM
jgi:hypothetical protein